MFRENIYEIIEQTGEKISTIIIPKNTGLGNYSKRILREAGVDIDNARGVADGILQAKDLRLVLKRGEDIPQVVAEYARERGELVLGLTGDDLYDEYRYRNPQNNLQIENTYDWDDESALYRKPTLCLINRSGAIDDGSAQLRISLNSRYTFTSRDYLAKSPITRGRDIREIEYAGGVELTVSEGIADCSIDIVYTGKTLSENGLQIVDRIRTSDLVLISALKREGSLLSKVLRKEYAQIKDRLNDPTDTYTSKILADPEKLTRKANEELYEAILAFWGKGDFNEEMADVIYALNCMMVSKNTTLDDLAAVMTKRQK